MKKGEATRHAILQKAQELMYTRGYTATSIDDILKEIPITKGSFYHHFSSKEDMGLAVVAEYLQPGMQAMFTDMAGDTSDPALTITKVMHHLLFDTPELMPMYGCPVGNLTDELAANNPDFRSILAKVMVQSVRLMNNYLTCAKEDGVLRADVDVQAVSRFIVSGYWGARTMGKLGNTKAVYKAYLQQLSLYLNSLKA